MGGVELGGFALGVTPIYLSRLPLVGLLASEKLTAGFGATPLGCFSDITTLKGLFNNLLPKKPHVGYKTVKLQSRCYTS